MSTRSAILKLIAGDTAVIFMVTLVGFLSHNESPLSLVNRFLATWIPFSLAWGLAGYAIGLFRASHPTLDRIIMATLLAAPLGAILRGLWLGTVVQTTFALVMAAVLALGMILWRWAWPRLRRRGGV